MLIPNESEDELTFDAIQHDQELLLNTFIAQYFKAQVYEQDNSFLPVIKPDLSFETTIKGEVIKFSKEKFLNELKKPL